MSAWFYAALAFYACGLVGAGVALAQVWRDDTHRVRLGQPWSPSLFVGFSGAMAAVGVAVLWPVAALALPLLARRELRAERAADLLRELGE